MSDINEDRSPLPETPTESHNRTPRTHASAVGRTNSRTQPQRRQPRRPVNAPLSGVVDYQTQMARLQNDTDNGQSSAESSDGQTIAGRDSRRVTSAPEPRATLASRGNLAPPLNRLDYGKIYPSRELYVGLVVEAPDHNPFNHRAQNEMITLGQRDDIAASTIGTYVQSKWRPMVIIAVHFNLILLPIYTKGGEGLSRLSDSAKEEYLGIRNATDPETVRLATEAPYNNVIFFSGNESPNYRMSQRSYIHVGSPVTINRMVPIKILGSISLDDTVRVLGYFNTLAHLFPSRPGNPMPPPIFASYLKEDMQQLDDIWRTRWLQLFTDLNNGALGTRGQTFVLPYGQYTCAPDFLLYRLIPSELYTLPLFTQYASDNCEDGMTPGSQGQGVNVAPMTARGRILAWIADKFAFG